MYISVAAPATGLEPAAWFALAALIGVGIVLSCAGQGVGAFDLKTQEKSNTRNRGDKNTDNTFTEKTRHFMRRAIDIQQSLGGANESVCTGHGRRRDEAKLTSPLLSLGGSGGAREPSQTDVTDMLTSRIS